MEKVTTAHRGKKQWELCSYFSTLHTYVAIVYTELLSFLCDERTAVTFCSRSNQSSKSVSPLPARDITLPVNLDQASLNTAIGVDHTKLQSTPENLEVLPDTLVDNQEKDSITTQRSAVSSTGMDSNDVSFFIK